MHGVVVLVVQCVYVCVVYGCCVMCNMLAYVV